MQVVVLCFSLFLGSFYQGLSPCSSVAKTDLARDISIQETYTTTGKHQRCVKRFHHHWLMKGAVAVFGSLLRL